MAEEEGFIPGPLDELVPGLRQKTERFAALPVHPRVVYARAESGARTVVFASFAKAASVKGFHAALKRTVEATLLSALSRAAGRDEETGEEPAPDALELFCAEMQPFDPRPALAPFALAEVPLDDPAAQRALALVRHEATKLEPRFTGEPVARYRAEVRRSTHSLAAPLELALRERAPREAWGAAPGVLAKACAAELARLGLPGIEPSRAGIELLESVVAHRTAGVVRWIEPLSYQALCDLIAVAAATTYGRDVEWGVCETDEETGLTPPPLIRVATKRESFHVPLGEHVLRWCVMPRGEGEEIPSLGAWAEHEFLEEA